MFGDLALTAAYLGRDLVLAQAPSVQRGDAFDLMLGNHVASAAGDGAKFSLFRVLSGIGRDGRADTEARDAGRWVYAKPAEPALDDGEAVFRRFLVAIVDRAAHGALLNPITHTNGFFSHDPAPLIFSQSVR